MKRTAITAMLMVVFCGMMCAQNIKMGVLLPFAPNDSKTAKMVEFYRGVLMAADSMANATGATVDITALDCGQTPGEMGYLLAKNRDALADADFIIGPQNSAQIPALAEFCDMNDVLMVVPFAQDEELLAGRKNMYMATSSRTSMAWHMELSLLLYNQFANDNVVMVQTGEGGSARLLPQTFAQLLSEKGRKVPSLSVEATEDAVKAVMKENVRNVCIVDGTTLESVNKTLSMLDAFMALYPDYKITLVGNHDWSNYVQHHMRNFLRYDTHIPVSFYRNAGNAAVTEFENAYMQQFRTAPINSSPRFAHMGFDLAWFFMNAVNKYGADINKHLLEAYVAQRPLQHGLYFQATNGGGYLNRSARFIHYAPNGGISLITR